jgi:flagellar hook-basal body complex protein FliE
MAMNLSLNALNPVLNPALDPVLPSRVSSNAGGGLAPAGGAEAVGSPFSAVLGGAMDALVAGQQRAEVAVDALARGKGSLHAAALALEEADVGLKLATKVRSRVVEAYQDLMRMPL